ncbi:60S ribosomal protein L10 [Linnemannia elongata]|nr:60S ribosomal protein L10 [Linnemannia elongata]
MRGAYGKPNGTAARVDIGQVIFSIRTKDSNKAVVIESLRRAKFKFAGRQKIIVSKKWGFTKLSREDYVTERAAGRLQPDGCYVKYLNEKGPLATTSRRPSVPFKIFSDFSGYKTKSFFTVKITI